MRKHSSAATGRLKPLRLFSTLLSLGLASVEEGEKETPDCETLLRHADEALYAAKARGRNRVETSAVARAAGPQDD